MKYLKGHVPGVLLILILLVVQAFCDLSLPAYTSDIVDVGIQNGGIKYATPEQIRQSTMDDLRLFMTPQDYETAVTAYDLADGVYTLRDKADLERLSDVFALPEVMYLRISEQGTTALAEVRLAIETGTMTQQQLFDRAQEAMASMGTVSGSVVTAAAIGFLKTEYQVMGMDLNHIRNAYLWSVGGRMLALTLLLVAVAITISFLSSRISAAIGRDLRERVFRSVMSYSSAEMDQFSTASLITRSTNDVMQVQMVCLMLVRIVLYAPIIGIGGIIKVRQTDTGLDWIVAVEVAAMILLVLVLLKMTMPKFRQMQERVDDVNRVSREILTGLPVIRAFHREKHEETRFDGVNTALMKTQLFVNHAMAFMSPIMSVTMYVVTLLIEWFGAKGIDAGSMQIGDMIAFSTYTMQIIMAFMMITMVTIFLPRAEVSAKRLDEVLTAKPSIRDPKNPVTDLPREGVVTFRNVSFRYPGADDDVLQGIDFTARPGQTTAIIGSTGCGKSTLLNLVPRFYDVTEGAVMIDGVDVRRMRQADLRDMLGYVPQKGVLFSGDIMSNLQFGGAGVSEADMIRAAETAQVEDFIWSKPQHFLTPIAQGGMNVSGGQKQRLSIARAIAKHPKIYLFDDSFSALDYKTDATLRRALAAETQDATILIVAQRISTILHADQIIVLNDGRIDGIGTHAELLRTCETYREIAHSQLSARELGEEA